MQNAKDINQLFIKYLDDTISKAEYEQLSHYFSTADHDELHGLILDALYQDYEQDHPQLLEETVDRVERQLRQKLKPTKLRLRWLHNYTAYAAGVLLLLTLGISYYLVKTKDSIRTHQQLAVDAAPGKQSATLTLADGRKVQLSTTTGVVITDSAATIKNETGLLVYDIKNKNKITDSPQQHTLATAKGETYEVVLLEGTKVWLNAGSSLTYDPNLNERLERVVRVTGEAYFEVAKDKSHPFIVESRNQRIRVLGTNFNVRSYANEKEQITTLAEGSVRVYPTTDAKFLTLTPGNEVVNEINHSFIRKADLETTLAWTEGKLYFKDAPVEKVMEEIARWYNVEIRYENEPAKALFNGGFKRTATLSEVIKILKISKVHCQLTKENGQLFLTIKANSNKS